MDEIKCREEFFTWHYTKFCKECDMGKETNQIVYNAIYSSEDNYAEREAEFKVWVYQQARIEDLKTRLSQLASKYSCQQSELMHIDQNEIASIYGAISKEIEQVLNGGEPK
ncbi:hypothetical protein ACWPO0_10305 [Acinetobacter nosocomialis]